MIRLRNVWMQWTYKWCTLLMPLYWSYDSIPVPGKLEFGANHILHIHHHIIPAMQHPDLHVFGYPINQWVHIVINIHYRYRLIIIVISHNAWASRLLKSWHFAIYHLQITLLASWRWDCNLKWIIFNDIQWFVDKIFPWNCLNVNAPGQEKFFWRY